MRRNGVINRFFTKQYLTKVIYLLQVKLEEAWQVPFHLVGGGPNPLSSKLADSGQIPLSSTPTMMSRSIVALRTFRGKPIKSHDLVVWRFLFRFGNTDATPRNTNHKHRSYNINPPKLNL